jgi:ketosteroid isomerase-like protein
MIGAHQSSFSANQQLIERAYAAFAQGDIPTVLASIAADILGTSRAVARFRAISAVTSRCSVFFQRFMELSNGTFRIVVDDVLARGDRGLLAVPGRPADRGRVLVLAIAGGEAIRW